MNSVIGLNSDIQMHISSGIPFVFPNTYESLKDWTISRLQQEYGDRPVRINMNKTGIYNLDSNTSSKIVLFNDYIRYSSTSYASRCYLQQLNVVSAFPELSLHVIEYICRCLLANNFGFISSANVWIGTSQSISPLHFDSADNFVINLDGDKEFWMVSPDLSGEFYPFEDEGAKHCSQVNLFDLDREKFPCFPANQHIQKIMLRRGDVLSIPKGYWHTVKNHSLTLAINVWWNRISNLNRLTYEQFLLEQDLVDTR